MQHHGSGRRPQTVSWACREWKSTTPRIVMYNYGSPRVGNAALAKEYNAAVPDSWRVTNKKDLVPQVPRSMGFCHVAHGLVIDGDKLSRSTGAPPPLSLLSVLFVFRSSTLPSTLRIVLPNSPNMCNRETSAL